MPITIDKAIEDLQARIDGEFSIKGVDDCKDIKLGRQALKFYKKLKHDGFTKLGFFLPGEARE